MSKNPSETYVSNEKETCLVIGYIGDDILPNYVGIILIPHDFRIPGLNNQYFMESSKVVFFS